MPSVFKKEFSVGRDDLREVSESRIPSPHLSVRERGWGVRSRPGNKSCSEQEPVEPRSVPGDFVFRTEERGGTCGEGEPGLIPLC